MIKVQITFLIFYDQTALHQQIDALVYDLYTLTKEEIGMVERELAHN